MLKSEVHDEPEEPGPKDCCGEGTSCVWDVYRERLLQWQQDHGSNSNKAKEYEENDGAPHQLSKIHFTEHSLLSITSLTDDTAVFPSYGSVMMPGQHLEMRNNHESGDLMVIRKYSPISFSKEHFDVVIKRYEGGKMSAYLEMLQVGDQVHWRGPYSNFKYNSKDQKLLLLLCAGTGIAPMIPIIRSIVIADEDETVIRLLCGCHLLESRLLLPQLKELAAFWNFSFAHHVTSSEGSPGWGETVIRGRITEQDVNKAMATTPPQQCRVLVCGPESFCTDMKLAVAKTGAECYCF